MRIAQYLFVPPVFHSTILIEQFEQSQTNCGHKAMPNWHVCGAGDPSRASQKKSVHVLHALFISIENCCCPLGTIFN